MACAHSFGEWCRECIDGLVRDHNMQRGIVEQLRQFVARERSIRDSITKGGQHTGHMPTISPSVLKELERILGGS